MDVISEFLKMVIECSAVALSLLLSSSVLFTAHCGRDSDTLGRQAIGFMALFATAVLVYLVI
jgi:hypothetical protein